MSASSFDFAHIARTFTIGHTAHYPMSFIDRLERVFFWLSGASADNLESCPAWERRKYVAFGATVLVPCTFAMIACAYAISTLTNNWFIITTISLVWAFIILTVDRALLATYRAYQNIFRKLAQFSLRIVVAALMGITISHPLTLLLFKDTIISVVEKERQQEIETARKLAADQKALVEARVKPLEDQIAQQRQAWSGSFEAKFLDGDGKPMEKPLTADEQAAKAERDARITSAVAPGKERLEAHDAEMAKQSAEYQKIAGELNHWQTEFEREVNGQRSGITGLGPRAKSIQEDQLTWRRAESARLSGVMETMTKDRGVLLAEIKAAEDGVNAALAARDAEYAAKVKAEETRVAALKQQVQQEQADQFVGQQNAIRETLKIQIDALLVQLNSLHTEIASLAEDEKTRIDGLRAEPRRDILTQTLALHDLFENGAEGGRFALTAYLVLSALFMLVDTIPLVVKFFSKPGPYDSLVDCDEVKYDQQRMAFLKSIDRYTKQLVDSPFLHITQNRPLERALIEGVDRSRAAKAFLEHLMDLEQAFQDKVRLERERLATTGGVSGAADMLEEMASAFYADLRLRMESFFKDDSHAAPGTARA
ncbi:uncharacterized protein DUF4407 [Prosthecobacter fusiformis]|uniref:Uncharacterized protein DUF4407 n=1 Tax=Prosthecobacter fusiformis TaxID=48464 RepID=A0A4V3FI31_9BACT|nr:DUF4407 domain-containing protein [Prosthecobacter fusiformis]TDU80903.1 uncharacterized protein DUF4407 [Prosthecobacter fusiformis]